MIAGRILGSLLTLVVAALAAFAVVRIMPGDPATTSLFQHGAVPTPELVAALRAEFGLDLPGWRQFANWLAGILRGDWGRSLRNGEPIFGGFLVRLPVSLAIGAGGLTIGAASAYGLALVAAAGSMWAERLTRGLAVLSQAIPAFVAGIAILYLFGVELRWLRPFTGGPLERILLPTFVVALYASGSLSRLIVLRMRDAMVMPWFMTARAKGCSTFHAIHHHAGGFGLIAMFAALKPEAAWLVGGSAVTEVLFGASGVSAWVVESIAHRDYGVLQGYILFVTLWMIAVHALAGFAVRRLDPRLAA